MFAVNYNGIYMAKDHRNIIVFDTPEEAIGFINSFFNYATTRAFDEADKNPFIITEIAMAKNSIVIEEFNYPLSNCKTINFKELEK